MYSNVGCGNDMYSNVGCDSLYDGVCLSMVMCELFYAGVV